MNHSNAPKSVGIFPVTSNTILDKVDLNESLTVHANNITQLILSDRCSIVGCLRTQTATLRF